MSSSVEQVKDILNATASANPANPAPVPPKKKESPSTQYIRPANIVAEAENAIKAVHTFATEKGLHVEFKFDFTQQIPDGFGVIIAANQRRDDALDATITTGYAIGICPDVSEIAKSAAGTLWIADICQTAVIQKFKNAVRPNKDGKILGIIPQSITDFITSQTRDMGLAFFNENAQDYVQVLKDRGLTRMTKAMLRDILQSGPFATQHYPSIPQANWETLINHMITNAKGKAKEPGILLDWIDTRTDTQLERSDIDFSSFAAM